MSRRRCRPDIPDGLLRHISREARSWIAGYNRRVKAAGAGCRLPSKSPWLNPIEPKWVHGKLGAADLMQRLCAHYRCPLLPPLAQEVA